MSISYGPGGMRRLSRRQFVQRAGAAGLGLAALGGLAACGDDDSDSSSSAAAPETSAAAPSSSAAAPAESSAAAPESSAAASEAGSSSAAAPTATGVPEELAYKGPLKIFGLGVDLTPDIKAAWEKKFPDVTLEFTVKSTPEISQIALTQPESQDLMSGYFHQMDQLWPSNQFIVLDPANIARWSEVSRLHKLGALQEGGKEGDGDAPFRKIFLEDDGVTFATGETSKLTMSPANHNSDSFGYNEKEIGEQDSWAILVDDQLKGRVALINDPEIGLMDAAMAVEAAGVMTFADKGNMTKAEIDEIFKYLIEKKKGGHFRAFWGVFEESVNLMQSGEVVAESMWSPAVTLLQGQDFPVRYAAPKEGYRGWGGGHSILKHVESDPDKLAAVWAYINWWNTPEPAGIMGRQGYYNAVIDSTKTGLEPAEADYWLNGAAAPQDLLGPDGKTVVIKQGATRDGGSYEDRNGNFSTWNSRMDEADYALQKWQEFLNA
jgi:putative spermidine/putrescine transport system substrate-binding protein